MKKYELYEEAARVAKMIEGTDLTIGNVVRCRGIGVVNPSFAHPPEEYTFALAIVEGKPVFKGDVLYSPEGLKFLAVEGETMFHKSSWNPPKPKTVMVELLLEDAREMSKYETSFANVAEACKKALEN